MIFFLKLPCLLTGTRSNKNIDPNNSGDDGLTPQVRYEMLEKPEILDAPQDSSQD